MTARHSALIAALAAGTLAAAGCGLTRPQEGAAHRDGSGFLGGSGIAGLVRGDGPIAALFGVPRTGATPTPAPAPAGSDLVVPAPVVGPPAAGPAPAAPGGPEVPDAPGVPGGTVVPEPAATPTAPACADSGACGEEHPGGAPAVEQPLPSSPAASGPGPEEPSPSPETSPGGPGNQ